LPPCSPNCAGHRNPRISHVIGRWPHWVVSMFFTLGHFTRDKSSLPIENPLKCFYSHWYKRRIHVELPIIASFSSALIPL
jgi:hypothetical protein